MSRLHILVGTLVWLIGAVGVSHAASTSNERQIAYQTNHRAIGARSAYAALPLANWRDTATPVVNFSKTCTYQGGPKSGIWGCQ